MIKNERQYKITRSQAEKFKLALKQFNELALLKQGFDPILVKAQRDALESQWKTLSSELKNYEALKSGKVRTLSTTAISELGKKLVEARIAQGLTQRELAIRLRMKEQQIQRYEKEQYSNASLERFVEVADALGVAFQLELNLEKTATSKEENPTPNFDVSQLPTKAIRDRGWLEWLAPNVSKSDLVAALKSFIAPAISTPVPALLRQGKRTNAKLDEYALLAWKARVIWKARNSRFSGSPNFSDLTWLKAFKEFTLEENGPALAVEYLRRQGILVIFEEHLPKTHLDGAALLADDRIFIIALTLRHDRLDNFWFVLLHELGHIIRHRESGLKAGFFDNDEGQAVDKLEREADEFATSTLLPTEFWLSSLIRFTQSPQQIVEFAKENHISSAIVAGWVRRERNDYKIFSELVGQGKVKKVLKKAGLLEAANVKRI